MAKKKKLTKKQLKYIEDFVISRLEDIDLRPWQASCKSLAPPNYDHITRTKWFKENKFRADTGKEVVDFVDKTTKILQNDEVIEGSKVADIRTAIVRGVRKAEQAQGISQYLLNEVKLATLRTIVGWVEHPEKRRRKGGQIEKSRRGRKKEKGKHRPPIIEIVKEWEILTDDTIRITSVLSNNYLHPYQNVELEVDFGPNLIVNSVSPYSWKPDEKRIRIGYLEANLGVDHLETEFTIDLTIRKRVETYSISCKVHFDNCDKGVREVSKRSTSSITLY
jgi:hypothetical protein